MKINRTIPAIAAALAIGLAASSAGAASRKLTIALIPGLTTDAFYITMHRGAEAAAAALGDTLVFQGAADFNPVTQVPVLDALIARHPDAILIAPTDRVQLVEPLKKAVAAGITVITVDTFIGDGKYQTGIGNTDFPLSYIASDNILGGEIAARALARAVGDKGKVYVANLKPGISTLDQREEGFRTEMKNHPGITVMATQFNDDDANKAASQLQSVLARNPDLAGVFGANLFSAIGAANGVKQARKTGQVRIAAFDAPKSVAAQLKAGLVDIAIAQHPAEIGYFGVVCADAALHGQSIPSLIGTGFTVMTKANIDDPRIGRFLYTQ